jgi:hypothetical protein
MSILNISGFSVSIIDCVEKLSDPDNCCSQAPKTGVKPWAFKIDSGAGPDNCDGIIKRRPEKGWTLDFVFNREGLNWSQGSIFYYIGVRGDDNIKNYADNNLSFGFTNDGRIKWSAIRYLGICQTNSGYTESYYVTNGQTDPLCVTDLNKDFNITITFDRYKRLTDCNLENDGGWNDLITGRTLNNNPLDVMTGATPDYSYPEVLNRKWANERKNRLGILKIYLNGRPIAKIKDFEEVIPSNRGVQPFIQSWGGGTPLMMGIHEGVSEFNIKTIKYYEEPLNFVQVYHNFMTRLNEFDFEICGVKCDDNLIGSGTNFNLNLKAIFTPGSIKSKYILTSDKPLFESITLNFVNNLGVISGSPITITNSVSIEQNGTSGSTIVNLNDDYNLLNATASYDQLNVVPNTINAQYTINYEFIFAPKNDLTYLIIPNNDINYNILPNGDLSYLIIPNNLTHLIIPNNDTIYTIIPNGELSYLIIPTGDLNHEILE